MKRTLKAICTIVGAAVFAAVTTTALFSFVADKFINVRFTEPQIDFHWKNLEAIKQVADQSQLPHQQVKFIVGAIDSLQKDMAKSAKVDSTVQKK